MFDVVNAVSPDLEMSLEQQRADRLTHSKATATTA